MTSEIVKAGKDIECDPMNMSKAKMRWAFPMDKRFRDNKPPPS